ncbi:hypothetical protein EVAR_19002_1 [Eumeta japonica]|uniref:Uncharacterized protein n=1 Tax=Eumeta variegata TaxID=151549 RepID=A0A4C1V718_EUMVA|nr:hypothetical protein EVAR_19002_1 [Eumeta japonica]
MESGFSKANSNNLPRVDAVMLGTFFASNRDFCSSEFRNVKASMDIFACRVVTQSVLSWRGLLATDCARAVVGVMARHGTTDKCVSIRRVARGANI